MTEYEKDFKEIIEKAGGIYRGIQYTLEGDENLVLFDDSIGSTKALPISKVTAKNVKRKLQENL